MMKMGIATRLALVFILYAMILLVSLAIPIYNNSRIALQTAITSELLSTAVEKQAALDYWIEEREKDIVTISQHSELIAKIERFIDNRSLAEPAADLRTEILSHLAQHAGLGKKFDELMFLALDSGQVLLSTNSVSEGTFKEDQPFFINGKNGPFIQTLYFSLALHAPAMAISTPILSTKGRSLGVLVGMLKIAEMDEIVNRRTGLHQSDDSFLVTTSNLFATQPRLIPNLAVLKIGIHTQAVNNCLLPSSGVVEADDYRGIPATIVYRWLPSQKLCLIVKIDQSEALESVRGLAVTLALVGSLVLLIGSIAAFFISRTITRPIQQLIIGTEELSKGNLDVHIGMKSQDEIGQLAKTFDRMAKKLKTTLVSRDDLVKEVKERKEAEKQLKTTLVSRDDLVKEVKERKEAEKQLKTTLNDLERSNKELEQFAYVASHDLQEPLRMVSSYTQLLEKRFRDKLDKDALDFIHFAVAGANRMQRQINDLLSFSRIGTRGNPLEPTDSHIALGGARMNLSAAIEESHAVVTNDDLPIVMADESQLVQIFQNLIGNAIKFHKPDESPRVHISAEMKDEQWVFKVVDNGIGIEPQYFERIFVIFQRLHSREDYQGTGIGLAICKKIVERHGGKIWVESQPGEGSTFYFTLNKTDLKKNKK